MTAALRWSVRPNAYHDSIKLMRVSQALGRLAGVERAAVVMATALNVELLAADGLLPPDLAASPDDLVIAVAGTAEGAEAALAAVDTLLAARAVDQAAAIPVHRLEEAEHATLALIAVPGRYAAVEAMAALHAGMHVFLFSDNVPVQDEIQLKRLASEKNLLMMGPDCGTAILGGVGLGFANRVMAGPVGIVGASGTGIQQVCALLDAADIGVHQAIGTGGRDLSAEVGGVMTKRGLQMLRDDAETGVIVVVSKPGDSAVANELHRAMAAAEKPVVACLLGTMLPDEGAVRYARTLTDVVQLVAAQFGVRVPEADAQPEAAGTPSIVRGFFAGGTLCSEAAQILGALGVQHDLLDLGADEYTRGRAHPIIDARLRAGMLEALEEPGPVLLDVILGDMAADPAVELLPAIRRAGQRGPVVVSLIGTRYDPQDLERQRRLLKEAGALVFRSNAEAAVAAARLAGAV